MDLVVRYVITHNEVEPNEIDGGDFDGDFEPEDGSDYTFAVNIAGVVTESGEN